MDAEVKAAYTAYVEANAQIKELQKKLDEAKGIIFGYHGYDKATMEATTLLVEEVDGNIKLKSAISFGHRKSLDVKKVESDFNIKITDDYYNTTTYPILKVSTLLTEC